MDLRFLFKESLTALTSAPIRSLLTMLGVIIGVAAVIAMMSIGGGAKLETLRQIRALGATNIYVKSSRKSSLSQCNFCEIILQKFDTTYIRDTKI